ncbi:flagellar biosynthesis anti-sigma factor FlgM [Aquabacterium sp. A08]|uniref:flagellar biosynthesis anti-sigma factor FlgM n=1 Tax=Aquabacterium sp. A08 TaxID=2718532 RepID=UPI001422EA2D|nr:flagellar biosynthesis anti-sigma factor FlgM [Aquabacterium sp. A08]NIC40236.1 flagellar biosynthesis anti-sigma factor FlgM [Aquabacterium sp. A08]
MKVNSLPEQSVSATSVGSAKPAERAAATPSSATPAAAPDSPASVSVKLSPVTQTMTNGVARSGTDVFNAEKVQAMRAAIQNGSFSVNAEAIADKMIANAREMLSVASAPGRSGDTPQA